jgi:O-antigen/teichoic acid export membrane protein
MISLSLIPAFYASLSDTLLQIVPKLHQNISALQRNQLEVSIGRLVLLFASMFVFPFAFVAIIANGVPRIYGNLKLYQIAAAHCNPKAKADREVRSRILKIVLRMLPGSIYYAISGQIVIWLASIFGNTTTLAQLGALGRISIIFLLLTTLVNTLLVPNFSKAKVNKIGLITLFSKNLILLILSCIAIILLVLLFDNYFLWLLGKNYYGLNMELFLITISYALGYLSTVSNYYLSSRGIIPSPFLLVAVSIIAQIVSILIFNLDSLVGIVYFSLLSTSIVFTFRISYFYYYLNFSKIKV